MQPQITLQGKPGNASWRAKLNATPDGIVKFAPDLAYSSFPHRLDAVEVAWYDDRVKITFPGAGPAYLSQVWITGAGRHVIVEVTPA
jgi:hypothetical protein